MIFYTESGTAPCSLLAQLRYGFDAAVRIAEEGSQPGDYECKYLVAGWRTLEERAGLDERLGCCNLYK